MVEPATSLQRNPFHVLGATTRDDRRQIVQLADEKLLELDQSLCRQVRSELTNPRNRLAAEMSWLPGVSPRRALDLAKAVTVAPESTWAEQGLPPLAHANLLSASLEQLQPTDVSELANQILEFARMADGILPGEVLRDINEDRAVAGFPEVQGVHLIEEHLQARKRQFRNAIRVALNRLPPGALVEAVTKVVDYATGKGNYHAPDLIDELVETYQVEAQDFLQREAANVVALIEAVRSHAPSGEASIAPLIDALVTVTWNWDRVAQPIQVSFMARGHDHAASSELSYSIRALAVDLFNDYGMLQHAQRLIDLLRDVFAEVPQVVDRIEDDLEALDEVTAEREKAESRREEWERSITYSAEVGTFIKSTLSISPTGVSWSHRNYPLDAITRVRWGGMRHSSNGIPTGTTYTIAFGDEHSEAVVETRREDVYSAFVDRLFRAVGVRLITQLLETVKYGSVTIGEAIVWDAGITVPKRKFLSKETVDCSWNQIQTWNADGSFYIGAKDDEKAYVELSYIHTPNTHILERVIRVALEKGCTRLSRLL